MKFFAFIACALVGGLLLSAVDDFPNWGDAHSPANSSDISEYYIEKTDEKTKVPNLVTAVLADYRGYDTLFETVVIFTAGLAIMAVLGLVPINANPEDVSDDVETDMIIKHTARLLVPVIQLFALYVVAHGHYSPGGGFQGGVIFGASLILLAITNDLPATLKRVSARTAIRLAAFGVLLYGGFGLACLLAGGNFLDYSFLANSWFGWDEVTARYHGMLWVEIGVGFTVSTIMFAIYAYLSSKGRLKGAL